MADTITIKLTNRKALRLIKDMEELDLIQVLKAPPKMSDLRKSIKSRMSNNDINQQLTSIRKEWQRDI